MTLPNRKDLLSIQVEHFLQEERFDLAYSAIIFEPHDDDIEIVENPISFRMLLGFLNLTTNIKLCWVGSPSIPLSFFIFTSLLAHLFYNYNDLFKSSKYCYYYIIFINISVVKILLMLCLVSIILNS